LNPVFDLMRHGDAPLLISIPHCGTGLAPGLEARLTPEGLRLGDTDWHLPRLYDFAAALGATVLSARHSRYVVDLNRPASGESLYPGQATTGLCPTTLFDGRPLYRDGAAPDAAEIAARVEAFWKPYHDALAETLAAIQARHGRALLWDAHSIRSRVPRLFEGRLPDLNLGTARGESCDPARRARVVAAMEAAAAEAGLTAVADGRFVGGYITRHYGRPEAGVDAVQMELAQCRYMDEEDFGWREDRAAALRPVLRRVVAAFLGA